MDSKNMTVQQLLNEFHAKAKHFMDLANELENTVKNIPTMVPSPQQVSVPSGAVTVQGLKEFMKDKAYRALHLSKQFNVPISEVEKLLTPENGFTKGNVGWVWVAEVAKKKVDQPVTAGA